MREGGRVEGGGVVRAMPRRGVLGWSVRGASLEGAFHVFGWRMYVYKDGSSLSLGSVSFSIFFFSKVVDYWMGNT